MVVNHTSTSYHITTSVPIGQVVLQPYMAATFRHLPSLDFQSEPKSLIPECKIIVSRKILLCVNLRHEQSSMIIGVLTVYFVKRPFGLKVDNRHIQLEPHAGQVLL